MIFKRLDVVQITEGEHKGKLAIFDQYMNDASKYCKVKLINEYLLDYYQPSSIDCTDDNLQLVALYPSKDDRLDVGTNVNIIDGQYAGYNGRIVKLIEDPDGSIKYGVLISRYPIISCGSIICEVFKPEQLCVLTGDSLTIPRNYPVEVGTWDFKTFDISKYLSDDDTKRISEEIFKEKVSAEIDRVLKARSEEGMTPYNEVLGLICNTYVDKLKDELDEPIMRVCKEEIARETPLSDGFDDLFRRQVSWALERSLDDWIKNNIDKLTPEFEKIVMHMVPKISTDHVINILKSQINIDDILRNALEPLEDGIDVYARGNTEKK